MVLLHGALLDCIFVELLLEFLTSADLVYASLCVFGCIIGAHPRVVFLAGLRIAAALVEVDLQVLFHPGLIRLNLIFSAHHLHALRIQSAALRKSVLEGPIKAASELVKKLAHPHLLDLLRHAREKVFGVVVQKRFGLGPLLLEFLENARHLLE